MIGIGGERRCVIGSGGHPSKQNALGDRRSYEFEPFWGKSLLQLAWSSFIFGGSWENRFATSRLKLPFKRRFAQDTFRAKCDYEAEALKKRRGREGEECESDEMHFHIHRQKRKKEEGRMEVRKILIL